MRTLLATLALVITAVAPAGAISRYNAANMSCAEAKAVIRSEGAVILRFRSTFAPVPRYGRFVDRTYFCPTGQYADTVFIPTADTKSCPVRECTPYDPDRDLRIWKRRN
jgi:hypothetical protein